jgi:hypothetical protein
MKCSGDKVRESVDALNVSMVKLLLKHSIDLTCVWWLCLDGGERRFYGGRSGSSGTFILDGAEKF